MLHHNYSSFTLEAGTDEAGRGCLAGPVTAAAVILPKAFEVSITKRLQKTIRENKRKTKTYNRRAGALLSGYPSGTCN